jgi:hypothetical protein
MKKILVAIAITAIVTVGISVPTTRYLTRCEDTGGTVEQGTPGPLSPTVITDNTPAGKYCGDKIDITGVMQGDDLFVGCRDNCKGNSRTFPMRAKCPTRYRPYSIMPQLHILAGYDNSLQRFDAMGGGTLSWLWNTPRGSYGVGATYLQSFTVSNWYAGATATAKLDFGKLKTIGE